MPALLALASEGHTSQDEGHVYFGHECRFPEITLPLAVLAFSEVPATLLATQDFAGTRDFEPLGNAFSGLASSNFLSHKRGGTVADFPYPASAFLATRRAFFRPAFPRPV
jgi:hypothetical protein